MKNIEGLQGFESVEKKHHCFEIRISENPKIQEAFFTLSNNAEFDGSAKLTFGKYGNSPEKYIIIEAEGLVLRIEFNGGRDREDHGYGNENSGIYEPSKAFFDATFPQNRKAKASAYSIKNIVEAELKKLEESEQHDIDLENSIEALKAMQTLVDEINSNNR